MTSSELLAALRAAIDKITVIDEAGGSFDHIAETISTLIEQFAELDERCRLGDLPRDWSC